MGHNNTYIPIYTFSSFQMPTVEGMGGIVICHQSQQRRYIFDGLDSISRTRLWYAVFRGERKLRVFRKLRETVTYDGVQ